MIEPGTLVQAVRLEAWWPLAELGFMTERAPRLHHLPAVEEALAAWLRGTHGATSPAQLDWYLDEFTFASTAAAPPTAACSSTASGGVGGDPAPCTRGRRGRHPRAGAGRRRGGAGALPGRWYLLLPSAPPKWSDRMAQPGAKIAWRPGRAYIRIEHLFDSARQRSRGGEAVDGPPCAAGSG